MIEEMMKAIFNNIIEKKFPHLKVPSCVYVKITKASENDSKYSYPVDVNMNLNLSCKYESSVSASGTATIDNPSYIYNLKILKEDKTIESLYDEIPDVKSYVKLDVGDIAAAILMYGKPNPFIVGKVV